MKPVIFYNVGHVITQAQLMGFCYPDNKDKCKHQACGYKTQYYKCPKCGKEIDSRYWYGTYCKDWNAAIPNTCDQIVKEMPLMQGASVQCKMIRFRFYTDAEVANPAVEIKFALIRVQFAATSGDHDFVADLEKVDFINEEMTLNTQSQKWLAHPSQMRDPIDISKISNKVDVIKQIHRVFE